MSATTPPETTASTLLDMETPLSDLSALTGLLALAIVSDGAVTQDHLHYIAAQLFAVHRKLFACWDLLRDEQRVEYEQHREALAKAEAKAKEAAPGSAEQMKLAAAMARLMRDMTRNAAEEYARVLADIEPALVAALSAEDRA